jgi:hypothetical protein
MNKDSDGFCIDKKIIIVVFLEGDEHEFVFSSDAKAKRFIKITHELLKNTDDELEFWDKLMMEYEIQKR